MVGRKLPSTVPTRLAQFLFWVGIPISIIAFLLPADLSGPIWIAPAIAYVAILLGAFLAWLGIKGQTYFSKTVLQKHTQGSLLLAAMLGNTGYLGFPITLAMIGKEYFAWALFYDLLGSFPGAYALGVALAARFGDNHQLHQGQIIQVAKAVLINPGLWSFGLGLLLRQIAVPQAIVWVLDKVAWSVVALSLILIGMRLAKLNHLVNLPQVGISLGIKMLIVPLILGCALPWLGLTGLPAKVIILQMAMPPAFACLVLAENFNLDRNLAVTTLAVGAIALLLTLPMWLWLY
uniref:Putative permease n=1 Tax=Nostoc sp. PCC 9448 TaxID=2099384 RepID=A0A2P0ZGI7_9NOSO|nr:putative permease [Nostoc sp. PCC 9448]